GRRDLGLGDVALALHRFLDGADLVSHAAPPDRSPPANLSGDARKRSRQPPQQKYQRRPSASAVCFAPATATLMPHTGSRASAAAATGRLAAPAGCSAALRRSWTTSARIETAISSGVCAPMSRPAGLCTRASASAEAPRARTVSRICANRLPLATTPRYAAS